MVDYPGIRIERQSAPRPIQARHDSLVGTWTDYHNNIFEVKYNPSGNSLDVILTTHKGVEHRMPNAIGFYASARVRNPEVALFRADATYIACPAYRARDVPRVAIPGMVQWVMNACVTPTEFESFTWQRADNVPFSFV